MSASASAKTTSVLARWTRIFVSTASKRVRNSARSAAARRNPTPSATAWCARRAVIVMEAMNSATSTPMVELMWPPSTASRTARGAIVRPMKSNPAVRSNAVSVTALAAAPASVKERNDWCDTSPAGKTSQLVSAHTLPWSTNAARKRVRQPASVRRAELARCDRASDTR